MGSSGIVSRYISQMFPEGTNYQGVVGSIDRPPNWPPDLFAVTASLLARTGGYWSVQTHKSSAHALDTTTLQEEISQYGLIDLDQNHSRRIEKVRRKMQRLWNVLLNDTADEFGTVAMETRHAALTLMLIADGASKGAGHLTKDFPIAALIVREHTSLLARNRNSLKYLHRSLCRMVPLNELRVLPKMISPDVGQTVRSLSRNLSLVDHSEVDARWLFGATSEEIRYAIPTILHILVVPFPYEIDPECFRPSKSTPRRVLQEDRYSFTLQQRWLKNLNGGLRLFEFISSLIDAAKKMGRTINAVVLPELALETKAAQALAHKLAARHSAIGMFISGVGSGFSRTYRPATNGCRAFVFKKGVLVTDWYQSKHHQWRLDDKQIGRYGLNARLDPQKDWWEDFQINRECVFCSTDGGFVFSALICEDLSRVEPVLPVIRAVGPNLIIALLMDDCQLKDRWSAAAASALAEDPGSGVLTVTSLGLIRKSRHYRVPSRPIIARWHNSSNRPGGSSSQEIAMSSNSQAVIITLATKANYQSPVVLDNAIEVSVPNPDDWLGIL